MRYNSAYIECEGKWAVTEKAGRNYFPNSLTSDEDEAKRTARIYSMQWHMRQIDKLFAEGVNKGEFGERDFWGDYVS